MYKKKSWLGVLAVTLVTLEGTFQLPLDAQECTPRSKPWFSWNHRASKANLGCSASTPVSCAEPTPTTTAAATSPNPAPADVPDEEETSDASVPNSAAVAPAMFSAPPAGGEITGATSGYGLRFPGLTIPEIRLQPLTLYMPNVVRTSRDAEMYVDGGRAPRITGAPAAYGPLMNAGIVPQKTASASPPKRNTAPAKKPPSTAPAQTTAPAQSTAPAEGCVPNSVQPIPPTEFGRPTTSTEQELIETRRALMIVNERLQRLQMEVGKVSKTKDAAQEDELPPSPTSSYRSGRYANSTALTKQSDQRATAKIVEASYSEDEFEDLEEPVAPAPARPRRNQEGSTLKGAGTKNDWAPLVTKRNSRPKPLQRELGATGGSSAIGEHDSYETQEDEVDGRRATLNNPAPQRAETAGRRRNR